MELMKVTPEKDLFEKLSALDKKCVGSDGWSAESFRSEVQKENGIVLCFIDNMQIVALLSGYFAEGEGDITSVAVDENFRRKGLAQKLIEEFIKILPENTESIFLEVRENNTPAINLYEKCGFEKLSVRKNFYTNPCENAIVMVNKLNNKIYSDIQFPDKTILEITFLNMMDFYSISFENNSYIIVGGDKDIKNHLIGIAEDDKVYYIVTDDKSLFCYLAVNIHTFIKELLLYDDYINTNNLPENPAEIQLTEFADKFRSHLTELDKIVCNSKFWSEVCEEMEYGII